MTKNGDTAPRKMTMKMVAARAGVDVSVISRLINNDPQLRISDQTRERVTNVIKELNYRPDPAGRELRSGRSGIIGLLIPDYGNPIYGQIIKGAEDAAVQSGYLLMTSSAGGGNWDEKRFADRVGSGRFDGVLIAQNYVNSRMLTLMSRLPFPILLLNQKSTVYRRYFCLNDARAARLAVSHLIELGHRRIGIIGGPQNVDTAERRQEGALETFRDSAIAPLAEGVLRVGYDFDSGAGAIKRLMSLKNPPTAVFVANVAAAIGVLHQAWRLGLSIPEQLSVITIHDLPLGNYLIPALTTVHMPLEDMGRRGVELLQNYPPDAIIEEVVETDPKLILRASTASLDASSPHAGGAGDDVADRPWREAGPDLRSGWRAGPRLRKGDRGGGGRLFLTDLDEDKLTEAAALLADEGAIAASYPADVTQPKQIAALMERVQQGGGGLDALVVCAGICQTRPLPEVSAEDWRRILDVNLTGSFLLAQAAGGVMHSQGNGAIVFFSSVSGRSGRPQSAHYAASKAAILSLTKSMALALGPAVRVNAVCPGVFMTEMWDEIIADRDRNEGAGAGMRYLDQLVSRTPLQRVGDPRELANVVAFLISDLASYITGQAWNVDGGMEMN